MANRDATDEEKIRAREYMRKWNQSRVEKLLANPTKLCACGCGDPVLAYNKTAKYARGHWTLGKEFGNTKQATLSPTYGDLRWAAGFLEGEGSFMATQGSNGYPVQVISAPQAEEYWPLEQCQQFFGGTISPEKQNTKTGKIYRRWYVHQARARGIMMTLYPLMSTKRQGQIRFALSKWQRNGHSTTWDRRRKKQET